MSRRARPKPGYAYLIRASDGLCKLGCSTRPSARRRHLAWKMRHRPDPATVELVHMIATDDMRWLERRLHARYAAKRVRGEWFALSPEDVTRLRLIARCDKRPGPYRDWGCRLTLNEPERPMLTSSAG